MGQGRLGRKNSQSSNFVVRFPNTSKSRQSSNDILRAQNINVFDQMKSMFVEIAAGTTWIHPTPIESPPAVKETEWRPWQARRRGKMCCPLQVHHTSAAHSSYLHLLLSLPWTRKVKQGLRATSESSSSIVWLIGLDRAPEGPSKLEPVNSICSDVTS
jgi:hypothetical protein